MKFTLLLDILNSSIEYSYSLCGFFVVVYIEILGYNSSSLTAFYVLVAHLSLAYVTKLVAYYIRVEDFLFCFDGFSLQYFTYVVNDFL